MIIRRTVAAVIATVAVAASPGDAARAQQKDKEKVTPETVMVTVHAKAGAEADLAKVMARHWRTVKRLDLVRDTPHLSLRGTEGKKLTYFVEIFTWRDAGIPDDAPPDVQAVWAEMNKLAEERGGRPGIDIAEVSVIEPD